MPVKARPRSKAKAAPEAAAKAPAASAPARGIGVGSRVQDSEGTCGEIVEANNAWLTMRTDAGEERKVRKFTLKLVASETGAAPALKAAATVQRWLRRWRRWRYCKCTSRSPPSYYYFSGHPKGKEGGILTQLLARL